MIALLIFGIILWAVATVWGKRAAAWLVLACLGVVAVLVALIAAGAFK
jgi:hypothetical protein